MLISAETLYGLRMTCKLMHSGNIVKHYLQFFYFRQVICRISKASCSLFTVPGVDSFLSQHLCQDPLEHFVEVVLKNCPMISPCLSVTEALANNRRVQPSGKICIHFYKHTDISLCSSQFQFMFMEIF